MNRNIKIFICAFIEEIINLKYWIIFSMILLVCIYPIREVSESMAPTLKKNDIIFVSNIDSLINNYENGDIVTIKEQALDLDLVKNSILPRRAMLIKRVIAQENDEIEISEGFIKVNAEKINYPGLQKPNFNFSKIKLEKGQVFIIGDNINDSYDSTEYGPVKTKFLRGKVVAVISASTGVKLY